MYTSSTANTSSCTSRGRRGETRPSPCPALLEIGPVFFFAENRKREEGEEPWRGGRGGGMSSGRAAAVWRQAAAVVVLVACTVLLMAVVTVPHRIIRLLAAPTQTSFVMHLQDNGARSLHACETRGMRPACLLRQLTPLDVSRTQRGTRPVFLSTALRRQA